MTGLIQTERRTVESSPLAESGFRPDVQALRGLAVLAVVAYHARLVPGGFVGVDVFFVISGFVIGRSLLARLRAGDRLSMREFSARRVQRLLPALAVMLSVVVLLAPFLAPVGAGDVTARTATAASLLHANFFLFGATRGGYFAPSAEWNPLLHTWSLSVEEQFYLVLPLALLGLWRLARRSSAPERVLGLGIGVAAAVSLVACVSMSSAQPGTEAARWAFFASPTRAWEFLAGLALVLVPGRALVVRGLPAVRVVGLAMILWATVAFSDATPFPGTAALVPVIGAALVILGGSLPDHAPGGAPGRRWSRPAEWLGDVSYSWYLWHWPLIVAAAAFWPNAGRIPLVAAAVVSLVPAWASYRLLERRFRATGPKGRPDPSRALRLAAVCLLVPIAASVASIGLLRWVEEQPEVAAVAAADQHLAQRSGCNGSAPLGSAERRGCTFGDGADHVVLLGDSNADQFSDTLAEARGPDDRLSIAVLGGCPMADVVVDAAWVADGGAACRDFLTASTDRLLADPPDAVVVANATDKYVVDDDVVLVDPTDGRRAHTPDAKAVLYRAGLERWLTTLTDAGIPVAVIETVPKPWAAAIDLDRRGCSAALLMTSPERCTVPPFPVPAATDDANGLERGAAGASGAATWALGPVVCPDRRCAEEADRPLWPEPQHLGVEAARSLAPTVRPLLTALLARDAA